MTIEELTSVIEDMKAHGFVAKYKKRYGQPHLRRVDAIPLMNKINALLADSGLHWNYAHSMAKKMFKREKVEYLDNSQLYKLAAALQINANRKKNGGINDRI